MYPKFIITQDGVLRFGNVYLHRDLLRTDEKCEYGGGFWKMDNERQVILLYGRSFDFGQPSFEHVRRIDWTGLRGHSYPLFYVPNWPDEDRLEPIYGICQY